MTTAKEAGARGGTIIHARGSAQKDAEHFRQHILSAKYQEIETAVFLHFEHNPLCSPQRSKLHQGHTSGRSIDHYRFYEYHNYVQLKIFREFD